MKNKHFPRENKGCMWNTTFRLFSVSVRHSSPSSHSSAVSKTDSILLALGESLHKSTQPSKIKERSHKRVFCFWGVFSLLNLCVWAMNTQHQGKYFYLYFKMSKSKELGVHNHSALVIWNIIEREVCQRNEGLGEERQSIWACACWEQQSIIEDRVKGLAKQPWCNLSSRI